MFGPRFVRGFRQSTIQASCSATETSWNDETFRVASVSTVNSEMFARALVSRNFAKIKPSGNGEITQSLVANF